MSAAGGPHRHLLALAPWTQDGGAGKWVRRRGDREIARLRPMYGGWGWIVTKGPGAGERGWSSSATGAMQEADEAMKLPSPAAALILRRSRWWAERKALQHRAKRRERFWSMAGIAFPPVILAAAVLAQFCGRFFAARLAPELWAGAISAVSGLLVSLVTLRAHFGRLRLELDKTELAWVFADRLDEAYAGLRAGLEMAAGDPAAEATLLHRSEHLEAEGRFGVPEALRQALRP